MRAVNGPDANIVPLPSRMVSETELPSRLVNVAEPVGAVVTDTGATFGITPLRPFTRPVRLTCTQCAWQVAVVGLPAIGERARDHALLHAAAAPRPAGRFAGPFRVTRSGLLRLSSGKRVLNGWVRSAARCW